MNAENSPRPGRHGYIGPSLRVRGRLRGTGPVHVRVDGKFEGDVTMEGELSVGESGVVVATVEAARVEVVGQLRGNVLATDEVAVRDGGLLEGDVRAARIAIDDGGALVGRIEMDFDVDDARRTS